MKSKVLDKKLLVSVIACCPATSCYHIIILPRNNLPSFSLAGYFITLRYCHLAPLRRMEWRNLERRMRLIYLRWRRRSMASSCLHLNSGFNDRSKCQYILNEAAPAMPETRCNHFSSSRIVTSAACPIFVTSKLPQCENNLMKM